MSVDNSRNGRGFASGDGTGGERAAVQSKNFAAFVAVSVAAVVTPFLGIWGFLALCGSYAAALAACSSKLKYAFFLPATALALLIYDTLGMSVFLGAAGFAFVLVCAAVLGIAIYRRQSATLQALSVALTAVLIVCAAALSYAIYAYGSVGAAVEAAREALGAYLERLFALIASAARRYAENDPQAAQMLSVGELASVDTEEILRTVLLSAPGFAAGLALVFGWLVQLVSRPFVVLIGRRDIVTDKKRIALPMSFAIVYLAAALIASFSAEESVLTVAASNVSSALVPAIFCVGVGYVVDFFRAPRVVRGPGGGYVPGARPRFPAMLVVMFIFSALVMPTFFVSLVRVAGVVGTIAAGIRSMTPKNK